MFCRSVCLRADMHRFRSFGGVALCVVVEADVVTNHG